MTNRSTLKATTPTDREIVLTRVFNAPRHLVWDTMSKPKLLKRWLFGPPGWTMTVCENDQRVGGTFRWVWKGPNGEEMSAHGVYQEVVPPERMTRTEAFAFGCVPQMGEKLATLALAEHAGKTTLTMTLLFKSKEERDGTIASGMERGVSAGYDRLDGLLETLKST